MASGFRDGQAYEVLNALTALAPSEKWEDEEAEDARKDN
jgi:hypothetical protein